MHTNENSFPELGQQINQLRRSLHVPIREICVSCQISIRTYYEVQFGKI